MSSLIRSRAPREKETRLFRKREDPLRCAQAIFGSHAVDNSETSRNICCRHTFAAMKPAGLPLAIHTDFPDQSTGVAVIEDTGAQPPISAPWLHLLLLSGLQHSARDFFRSDASLNSKRHRRRVLGGTRCASDRDGVRADGSPACTTTSSAAPATACNL